MDFDKKDGFSYLDGVPVKISSKFLPPRPVVLSLAYDAKLTADLLEEEYDFSLERKVLESQKTKTENELPNPVSPEENIASEVEPANDSGSAAGFSAVIKPINNLSWKSDILQPKPQQPLEKVANDNEENMKKINLSDFENDTSSPFDYMELQIINDLEELSSVFQGLNNDQVIKERAQNDNNTNKGIPADSKGNDEPISNFSKSPSFPLPQNPAVDSSERLPNSSSEEFRHGPSAKSTPYSKNYNCATFSYPFVSGSISNFNSGPSEKKYSDITNCTALSEVPYTLAYTSKSNIETSDVMSSSKTMLRGCRSYSDVHSLSKDEIPNSEGGRSRTPPSIIFSAKVSDPYVSEKNMTSSNGNLNCDSQEPGLPDPYDELEDKSKQLVNSITDMGFSRPQVARAVKHLGTDEKTVVEHLCQIQTFVEAGYDSLEAEAALHLHDCNKDEAKTFLDLVSQLQDFGFEKDAVKKALVQNKNDYNKTIDALLH